MEQESPLSHVVNREAVPTVPVSLASITDLLVIMIHPAKIFAITHNNVTSHEVVKDYDLLIVVPDTAKATFKDYTVLIKLACFNHVNVTCSIHQANFVVRNLFYANACREANLVYDNGSVPLPKLDISLMKAAKIKNLMFPMKQTLMILTGY